MGSVNDQDGRAQGPLLTVKQTAQRLGLTEWQVRHGIQDGSLPALRISEHRLRVRVADVARLLAGGGDQRLAALKQSHNARLLRQDIERIAVLVRELEARAEALIAQLDDAAGQGEDHR